ncbi:unnamed protein product, partial [Meganyctiphanes norvegica]
MMWLNWPVLASVFLVLIWDSECKPQTQVDNLTNDDFLSRLSGECQLTCTPLDMCNDPRPTTTTPATDTSFLGLVNERNSIPVVNIGDRQTQTSLCPLLSVCCANPKQSAPVTVAIPECGIRNTNGIRVTVEGFKDGQAQYGEFPWMVGVFLAQNNEYVGGASLVHPRVVLTAGHKIQDYDTKALKMGDDRISHIGIVSYYVIQKSNILYQPDLTEGSAKYYIGILAKALSEHTSKALCAESPKYLRYDRLECILAGAWYLMYLSAYQKIMKAATVPGISDTQCEAMLRGTRLGPTFTLHKSFNCAGGTKEDACEGDGGSPLVCPNTNNNNNPNQPQYVQMGIVSWGIGCGIPGNPGVYASIPKSLDWIKNTIQAETFQSLIDTRGKV